MGYTRRIGRIQRVDVHRNVHGRVQIEGKGVTAATGLNYLDAEALELFTMMIVDGAQPHLN